MWSSVLITLFLLIYHFLMCFYVSFLILSKCKKWTAFFSGDTHVKCFIRYYRTKYILVTDFYEGSVQRNWKSLWHALHIKTYLMAHCFEEYNILRIYISIWTLVSNIQILNLGRINKVGVICSTAFNTL